MLRRLHNHIFTVRLKQVFDSPLVLVYQTLGHVDHSGVKQQLEAGVAKQLPASNVRVDICHMKNTMAAATGNDTLTRMLTNSNLLVGFKPQLDEQQQQQQQDAQQLFQAATARITRAMSPQDILGGLLQQPLPGPHIPQPQLKACVESAGKLPDDQPLVLIGAFYKRAATPLSALKKWVKLDQTQVYGELLGALEGPMTDVLVFEGGAEELLACLDDAAGPAIAGLVDVRAATACADAGPDAAVQQHQ